LLTVKVHEAANVFEREGIKALLEEAKELFRGITMRHLWLDGPGLHNGKEKGKDWVYKKVLGCRAHTHRLKGPRRRWVRVPEGEEPPPPRPTREKRRVSLLLCCPEAVGRGGGGAELFVD
jgi:hypothetical protein